MKSIGRYISAAVLAILAMASLSSCVYDSIPSEPVEENDNITLFIRLGILDGPQSRADAPNVECMHSIRVVLVGDLENGEKVEYNNFISYREKPVIKTDFMVIPTVRGKKKIFFFANEESVTLMDKTSLTTLLEGYPAGSDGTKFEEAVKAAYFELNPAKPLPMTSEYQLDAGRSGENNYTFYVVPVATKFTFNITNKREDGASTIKSISIDKLADANYVMPHVEQQYRTWTNADGSTASLYWIDWLKNVVEVTNRPENEKVPNNYDENQRLGWIFDYELPIKAQYDTCEMFVGERAVNGAPPIKEGEDEPQYETETFGPYYYPESKSLKDESNKNGAQQYTLHLDLVDGTGREMQLSRELTFVTALFRNTHVVVDITMEMGYMHVFGEIQPWNNNNVYGMLTEED